VTHGELETSVLYREDNLTALTRLPSDSVDLIYLDPPFFSSRVYEVIWGDEAEVRSFEDRWEGGMLHYINWMRDRLRQLHRVLKPTGSLYLHSDPHASHYLKVMLDELFGAENFRSEIVWRRTLAKGLSTTRLPNNHDLIFLYGKSKTVTWNQDTVITPYDHRDLDEKTLSKYRYRDPDGRRYRLDNLVNPNHDRPNLTYEFLGVTRVWRWTEERMHNAYADGIVIQTRPGRVPQLKRYLDEQRGRLLGDVWIDIPPLNSRAAERLGYPTQKPEALLARLVRASSNKGDVVLDPFCGCGTTISVAQQLDRRWIGIDISPTAVNIMTARLDRIAGAGNIKVLGLPETTEQLRELKPFEFQNWVIRKFFGTHSPRKSGDMGIDGYSFMLNNPIQVKRSDRVGRNVVDNFETAMRRGGHDVGYIVAFSFTKGSFEEVARARWQDRLEIRLVTVKDLLQPQIEDKIPELATVTTLPIAPPRSPETLPTAEELIASDTQAG
jgi:DNA modification methylase